MVSIGTIMAVGGVRDAGKASDAKKVSISPIIPGAPVKCPADKLMHGLAIEVSAYSVAKLYSDSPDTFTLDLANWQRKNRIERLGFEVKVANTLMKSLEAKNELASCT